MIMNEKCNKSSYGGQAVINGVMIRGKDLAVTACRRESGELAFRTDTVDGILQKNKFFRLPFFRGGFAMIDSLTMGYKTLMWSGDIAMEDEARKAEQQKQEAEARGEKVEAKKEPEKISGLMATLTAVVSFAIGIAVFVWLPSFLIGLLHFAEQTVPTTTFWSQFIPSVSTIVPNILEGVLRLIFLVLYVWGISFMPDIKTVFQYHGAEHKTVNAYEVDGVATVEGAKKYSRIHPRCGSSFLFLFFFMGIIIHALIGWPEDVVVRLISRIILIPVIAGIAYEMIKLSGKYRDSFALKLLVWPGLALQQITTAEPTDDQIEVAIASLNGVIDEENKAKETDAVSEDTEEAAKEDTTEDTTEA